MKILESKFVQGFIKMANDGYLQGWHERNGGNLSYRLKPEEVEMIRPRLNAPGEWIPIGVEVPGLAGEFFLVTGSGKYFRNIIVVDMRRDNPFHLVLAISAVSVAFMCPCMSFAATVLIKHAPASQIIPTWLQTTAMNFPMAFFWQIFYAGPFVRFIFGKLFPEKEKAAASAE